MASQTAALHSPTPLQIAKATGSAIVPLENLEMSEWMGVIFLS